MNIQPKSGSIVPETVTTGPLTGSKKVYYTVPDHPDVKVPYREISVTDPKEPPVRVYDASGPYTEVDARIDLAKGLPRIRAPWLARRANLQAYSGREVRPEDNGGVTGERHRQLLRDEGVGCHVVPIAEETRESFSAHETSTGNDYRFVLPGPHVSEAEWQARLENAS